MPSSLFKAIQSVSPERLEGSSLRLHGEGEEPCGEREGGHKTLPYGLSVDAIHSVPEGLRRGSLWIYPGASSSAQNPGYFVKFNSELRKAPISFEQGI